MWGGLGRPQVSAMALGSLRATAGMVEIVAAVARQCSSYVARVQPSKSAGGVTRTPL